MLHGWSSELEAGDIRLAVLSTSRAPMGAPWGPAGDQPVSHSSVVVAAHRVQQHLEKKRDA